MTHAEIAKMIADIRETPWGTRQPEFLDHLSETLAAMHSEITRLKIDAAALKLKAAPFKAFSGIRNRKGVLKR